jgi:hypothetical protein
MARTRAFKGEQIRAGLRLFLELSLAVGLEKLRGGT